LREIAAGAPGRDQERETQMQVELLAEGYIFLEAPRVDAKNNLYFSDIQIGGVFKRAPDGKLTHLIPDRKWIGGLAFNADGRIIASGHGGLVIFDETTGKQDVLLDKVDGKPIKGINDIQPDGDGGLYAGVIDTAAQSLGKADASPLLHLAPNGRVRRVMEDINVTNGIGLSPDRKIVYQAETMDGVLAYDRAADGSCSNRRLAIKHPFTDGIAVDAQGGVWVAAVQDSSVKRFTPDGKLDRRIDVPVKEVASLTFGGADLKDMYIVTGSATNVPGFVHTGKVFRVRSEIAGLPTPLTKF
jgi:sugar lactone lactonase YvrE